MTGDQARVIGDLRAKLAEFPETTHPEEHATIQFNLGLALAEALAGDRQANLRQAIEAYAAALSVFDEHRYPLFRGRVLTALGACERDLGLKQVARDRFVEATQVLEATESVAENGAAFNNLGLSETDLGDFPAAVRAFDRAVDAFSGETYTRQRSAALVNRGLAKSSHGSAEMIQSAIGDYRAALELVDHQSAPYVFALANHSLGVALLSAPGDRTTLLADAIRALDSALSVFTRTAYPFQHALTKNNLAVAYEEIGPEDPSSQRRSLARLEEVLMTLDPRVNTEQWKEANSNFHRVLQRLEALTGHSSRNRHFVELLAALSSPERLDLLRFRLRSLLELPEPHRSQSLEQLDRNMIEHGGSSLDDLTVTWLEILMEQPHDHLETGLSARIAAQQSVSHELSVDSAHSLEAALGQLEVIQRMRVRDLLDAMGHDRPDPR